MVAREIRQEIIYRVISSPFGPDVIAADGNTVRAVGFGLKHLPEDACQVDADPLLDEAERQLGEYFQRRRHRFDLPLFQSGTTFQIEVWQALMEIPYGETISYGELARRLDLPRAVRAVGAANGCNAIAIVVPCHRVIGGNGQLTGYAGGLAIKEGLLLLEGSWNVLPQMDLFQGEGPEA